MEVPQFCPNRECEAHHRPPSHRWWRRHGRYTTALTGAVQRFRCLLCGCGFSEQTLRIDYYAKRALDYRALHLRMSCCCGMRALGRIFAVDHKTIANKLMRLSRQAIAAHCRLLGRMRLHERLVVDGMQSFWQSQFAPNNLHLLAGFHSQFLYAWNGVSLRRSGRMNEAQLRLRAARELRWKAPGDGLRRSFTEIIDRACSLASQAAGPTVLHSDQHTTYREVLAGHGGWGKLAALRRVEHRVTPSGAPRTTDNPLFSVNYLERELRKDLAEHVRESTRFARAAHATMERLSVYALHHNCFKRYRINQPLRDDRTHAAVAGATEGAISEALEGLYSRRAFFSRSGVWTPFTRIWMRMYETPMQSALPYLPAYLRC